MVDVSILVAVISASAGVAGAGVSPVAIAFREGRQAQRDRQDRQATDRKQAYLDLLRAVVQLRLRIAAYYEHKGSGLRDQLTEVRTLATDAELEAANVQLLVSVELGTLAENLASAAIGLAEQTARDTDQKLDAVKSECKPDYDRLDDCARALRTAARGEINS